MKGTLTCLGLSAFFYYLAWPVNNMNTGIKPGDRVVVTRTYATYDRGKYTATVVKWANNGLLTVLPDGQKKTKNVSSDNVKKIK